MKNDGRLSILAASSAIFGVLGFAAFLFIPIALAAGGMALRRIKKSRGALGGASFAVLGITLSFVAVISAFFVLMEYEWSYKTFKVPTASMRPSIRSNARIFVDMAAYRLKSPERGDIVIYELLENGRRRVMCKRIVAMPGEVAEIRGGKVYVDGLPLSIPGLPSGVIYENGGIFGAAGQLTRIPVESYYVLGDNPEDSFDSRQHGPVARAEIKGKYLFVLW